MRENPYPNFCGHRFVYFLLPACACECAKQVYTLCSSGTGALVCIDEVDAGSSILAGLRLTFIDFFGAVHTVVARDTLTEKQKNHYE